MSADRLHPTDMTTNGRDRAFDYSGVPADVATEARRIANRVRARHEKQIAAVLAAWQKERERLAAEAEVRKGALERLAVLLVELAGDDLDEVVTLLEEAQEHSLLQAVRALLGAARPAMAGEGEPALSA